MTDKTRGTSDLGKKTEIEAERFRQRLLALERESEWLRSRARLLGLGLLVTLVLGAVGAFGQGAFSRSKDEVTLEVLTAQRVVIQDDQGVARGEWRVDEEGNTRMGLLDRQGRTRLSFSVLSGGSPGLSLVNANGRGRAGLALLPDESTSLSFADATGTPRVVMGLNPGDAAHLVFADANGAQLVVLGLDEMGLPSVVLPQDSVPLEDSVSGNPAGGSW